MLKYVEKSNPGILFDGDRVWNIDETSTSCEFGKRTKGFGSSKSHHGGFVASSLDSIGLALKTLSSSKLWVFSRELGLFEEIQEYK